MSAASLETTSPMHDPRIDESSYSDDEKQVAKLLVDAGLYQLLWEFHRQLALPSIAERVWECFTPAERDRLDNDFAGAYGEYGPVGMWMRIHGHDNRFRALVHLAAEHGHYSKATLGQLRRVVGTDEQQSGSCVDAARQPLPRWDATTKTLYLDNQIVRRLRQFRQPSRPELIILAFHEAVWAREIPCPLSHLGDGERHRAIHELNARLQCMRFHAGSRDGDAVIYWERPVSVSDG